MRRSGGIGRKFGQVAKLADAMDSKSIDRKIVRVQLPPWP